MAEAFTYKLTTEKEMFVFDFSQVLGAGEGIATATCSIIVIDGYDSSPEAMFDGPAGVQSKTAVQLIQGGIAGVTYRLIMTVMTGYGYLYTAVGDLPVYDPSQI
jgi:hypothetical protein